MKKVLLVIMATLVLSGCGIDRKNVRPDDEPSRQATLIEQLRDAGCIIQSYKEKRNEVIITCFNAKE